MSGLQHQQKHAIPNEGAGRNLGVLFCGYVEKLNPYRGVFKKRYLVLTHEAIHWFLRGESDDLFGTERGLVTLSNVLTVRILDEDTASFELQSSDFNKRVFKCFAASNCEEWVSAIRSTVKKNVQVHDDKKVPRRRMSLSAAFGAFADPEEADDDGQGAADAEVSILVVSLNSKMSNSETVITRNPSWKRLIRIHNMCRGDELIVTMSNGGTTTIPQETLLYRADVGADFESAIQNVLLSSSLKIKVQIEENMGSGTTGVVPTEKTSLIFGLVTLLRLSESNTAMTIVLILVITVSLISIRNLIGIVFHGTEHTALDSSIVSLFALLLAAGTVHQLLHSIRNGNTATEAGLTDGDSGGSNLCIYLLEHQYISPDDPVKEPEEEIPQRFIVGCNGDLREARRRWDLTRKWRETEGINNILNEPEPYFTTIKTLWPHYICGRGLSGHPVYYERPGDIELDQMKARGITLPDLLRHWIFITEYFWTHVAPDPQSKAISVLDIGTVKMADFAGETLEFVRKTIAIANQHYPERAYVVFVVNAPSWFSWAWKLVKPLVHENTQKKVKILAKRDILSGLQEHIDISQIPCYYGGQMCCGITGDPDSCRFHSPDEIRLAEFVSNIGKGAASSAVESNEAIPDAPGSPRQTQSHFHRAISFTTDDHPPPPPPSTMLTESDGLNDSPIAQRIAPHNNSPRLDDSNSVHSELTGSPFSVNDRGPSKKYSTSSLARKSSPLTNTVGRHTTLQAVFPHEDDDYSSQGVSSSIGGGGTSISHHVHLKRNL